jgi:hypothetical protein
MERDMSAAQRRQARADLVEAARVIGYRIRDPFWLD